MLYVGCHMKGFRHFSRLGLAIVVATLLQVACGDRLVQTADRSDDAAAGGAVDKALDCSNSAPLNQLPPGAAFGEGDGLESPLFVGNTYGSLDGPGIYLAARDTFRVYVNGQLVGQSDGPRKPLFIPLSLLPGENVIAVTVHASTGTPAALVVLDELDRSYASGTDWRMSTSPEGDWQSTGYDDSGWPPANLLSSLGTLSECEPGSAFPVNTTAAWIGPKVGTVGPVALRKTIRIEPIGFAAGVTGGIAAAPQRVSTWSDFEALVTSDEPATILLDEGLHDFRRTGSEVTTSQICPVVCADDASRTVYQGLSSDSTCSSTEVAVERDERRIRVGSNKTIVGLGRGARVRGVSLHVNASENLIVRNVALFDINQSLLESEDAINMAQATGVWLDHITVKWASDAFADILAGTEGVTVSHSLFEGSTDAECGGQERWAVSVTDAQVTIHHSRFEHLSSHAPYADGALAQLHLFNNVFSNTTSWTVGSSCFAQVLLEGSVFENVEGATRLSDCGSTSDLGLMNAVAGSNVYRDGTPTHLGGDGSEPHDEVFVPEYAYDVEAAMDAWPQVILRAGTGGPWAQPITLD